MFLIWPGEKKISPHGRFLLNITAQVHHKTRLVAHAITYSVFSAAEETPEITVMKAWRCRMCFSGLWWEIKWKATAHVVPEAFCFPCGVFSLVGNKESVCEDTRKTCCTLRHLTELLREKTVSVVTRKRQEKQLRLRQAVRERAAWMELRSSITEHVESSTQQWHERAGFKVDERKSSSVQKTN